MRDGREAVPLAEKLVELKGDRDPIALDALAAVYAASGRFREATALGGAADLAEGNGGRRDRGPPRAPSKKTALREPRLPPVSERGLIYPARGRAWGRERRRGGALQSTLWMPQPNAGGPNSG